MKTVTRLLTGKLSAHKKTSPGKKKKSVLAPPSSVGCLRRHVARGLRASVATTGIIHPGNGRIRLWVRKIRSRLSPETVSGLRCENHPQEKDLLSDVSSTDFFLSSKCTYRTLLFILHHRLELGNLYSIRFKI